MRRRDMLKVLGLGMGALAVPKLWVPPTKRFFLPPVGGWPQHVQRMVLNASYGPGLRLTTPIHVVIESPSAGSKTYRAELPVASEKALLAWYDEGRVYLIPTDPRLPEHMSLPMQLRGAS
jgi:hypothetical protein